MLKKSLLFISILLLLTLTISSVAQFRVKREPMSPNKLGLSSSNSKSWPVYTGLRTVGKGQKIYVSADTTGTYSWTIVEKPAGSTAVIDTPSNKFVRFVADQLGRYVVEVTVGSKTARDTFFANTFMGTSSSGMNCATCHASQMTTFSKTNHYTMYGRGITGQIEVGINGKGTYGGNCMVCHVTGFEPNTDNGNYGYLARQSQWDSLWFTYRVPPATSPLNVYINYQDSTIYKKMVSNYSQLMPVANIGCESCHGAGKEHMGDKTKTSIPYEAGPCMVCHDAPKKHMLGSLWAASNHGTLPTTTTAVNRNTCFPCHNGSSFIPFLESPKTPNYSKVDMVTQQISCIACHDPHDMKNPSQLRTVKYVLDTLIGGYRIPDNIGGKGKLCMNCHRGRYDSKDKVARQMKTFSARFYPHYSPQTDMFVGANAYEYGMNLSGLSTHTGLEDGCATCHMQERTIGIAKHSDHQMTMKGQDSVKVEVCKSCHGSYIEEFGDIVAATDYDGNGKIESVETEIKGLLTTLKGLLPLNVASGEPCTEPADTSIVYNFRYPKSKTLPGIWNYYFVKYDWSNGIHNTKYAAAVLKASIGYITGVKLDNPTEMPKSYSLGQNYPNPFNPSTEIKFAIPYNSKVSLQVYNSIGKLVKTLADGDLAPGSYITKWNGDDNNGSNVASGMYIYRLVAESKTGGKFVQSKKMVFVK